MTPAFKRERERERGCEVWCEIIYISLYCHHQKDSCIKVGSDESHLNVSSIVRDKVTRQCPQTTAFLKRKGSRSGIDPRPFCFPA